MVSIREGHVREEEEKEEERRKEEMMVLPFAILIIYLLMSYNSNCNYQNCGGGCCNYYGDCP